MLLALVVAAACAAARPAQAFSCVCSPSECEPLSDADCPGGGTVWDPCGCCRVCARVENEPCGGPYGFYGSCARGLECVVAAGKPVLVAHSEGVCMRTPGSDVRCADPVRRHGCNMVGHRCKCYEAPVCPGDAPFAFASRDECNMNLAVMLAHEQADVSAQDPVRGGAAPGGGGGGGGGGRGGA